MVKIAGEFITFIKSLGQNFRTSEVKFGYSEKITKFEKIFHLEFDATQ